MSGKKGKMARRLVYYCIGVLSMVTLWAVVVKTIAPSIDLTDVLTFVGGVFGFELLALLLKRILAKPNENKENNSYE